MTALLHTASRQGGIALPWRSLALVLAAIAAYTAFGPAPEAWVFDRTAIAQGEWWRLLTAHAVHSDPTHAQWDIGALLCMGFLFESRLRWRLPLALLAGAAAVDAWLWWGPAGLQYYCGLSGVLNSLLIVGLLELWRALRHPVLLLTASGAGLKVVVESLAGQALFTDTAWSSVPSVHAAGFLCGLALYAGLCVLSLAASRPARIPRATQRSVALEPRHDAQRPAAAAADLDG